MASKIQVKAGNIKIGGGAQVSVQSMLNVPSTDIEGSVKQAIELEKAGCHVIYGLLGLKVHSKITMVVRREEDGIRRYVHLGTGNYNDSTAKLYTDMGIFTCDAQIGADATAVFNMLSGYSEPEKWYKLLVAPIWMKKSFLRFAGTRIIKSVSGLCNRPRPPDHYRMPQYSFRTCVPDPQ